MKSPEITIVGGGPVGLWVAIQAKLRSPKSTITVYERHAEYQRSHVLRLEGHSMQLYAKPLGGPAGAEFLRQITRDDGYMGFVQLATNVFTIGTNELEAALRTYAGRLGVQIRHQTIESLSQVEALHPDCRLFVAADGAKSQMRTELLGQNCTDRHKLQYCVELKYKAVGKAGRLDFWGKQHRANQKLHSMAIEYVGRETDGLTAVTVRFFVDQATYEGMPEATFKEPLDLNDQRIPADLASDIRVYLDARAKKAPENYLAGSGKITKLTLDLYAAKRFAVEWGDRSWFLAGDAAMGLPYFRSLNSGMIVGSQLAGILTAGFLDQRWKIEAYEACRPLDRAFEFAAAHGKNLALKAYDWFRQVRL